MSDAAASLAGQTDPVDQLKSLFAIDISGALGRDFAPIANDFMRMLCIQLVIQVLMTSNSGSSVLSAEFFVLLLYVAIGIMLYWAVVRKLVVFR